LRQGIAITELAEVAGVEVVPAVSAADPRLLQ
jgi:hypothetical protein